MRSSQTFQYICKETAEHLQLELPQPSRKRKLPSRYEYSSTSQSFPTADISETASLRKSFFEVLDIVTNEIVRRFDQSGMENLVKLEQVITDAAKCQILRGTTLKEKLGVHATDFDLEELEAQLILLPSVVKENLESSFDICQKLAAESITINEIMSEVLKLVKLISIVPASAATAERSFSALRRLKTYLRTNMTQKRLTHLLLLTVHEPYTSKINLDLILKEFVCRTAERKSVFGN